MCLIRVLLRKFPSIHLSLKASKMNVTTTIFKQFNKIFQSLSFIQIPYTLNYNLKMTENFKSDKHFNVSLKLMVREFNFDRNSTLMTVSSDLI